MLLLRVFSHLFGNDNYFLTLIFTCLIIIILTSKWNRKLKWLQLLADYTEIVAHFLVAQLHYESMSIRPSE